MGSRKRTTFYTLVFALIFSVWTTPSFAGPAHCIDLFSRATSPVTPKVFSVVIDSLITGRVDVVKSIHESFVAVTKDPSLRNQLPLLIDQLHELQNDRVEFSGLINQYIEQTLVLARLAQGDMNGWKALLVGPDSAMENFHKFGTEGTMGYLLKALSPTQKTELLRFLGKSYHEKKNRTLIRAVHILLDPKSMYQNFKREGRSDRDFYYSYLARIREALFKGLSTGGYSPDLVVAITHLVQNSSLMSRMSEVNFFGSVVNGFGKPDSDLDIYDSQFSNLLSEEEIALREEEYDYRHLDLFNHNGNQFFDKGFNVSVEQLLQSTPWRWHLNTPELDGVPEVIHEHFGGMRHVFSFHISKQKVVLRFYPDSIVFDEHAQTLPMWNYIELDLTD